MNAFPEHAGAVTPAWLEAQLRAPGRLSGLSHVAIGTGQVGDTARFSLTWDPPGAGPATLAAKFAAADPTSRATAAMLGLYAREVNIYRELVPRIAVRVPRVFAAEIAADGSTFVLLFEDLGPARGGNQLDGCAIDDARHAVVQLAGLHAPTWNDPALAAAPWLQPVAGATEQVIDLYPKAHAVFRTRYCDALAPDLMAVCDALAERAARYYRRNPAIRAVCHGDFRLDNLLFGIRGGAEPIAVVDWQTAAWDCPIKDLAYFLGCGIGSTLRRPHEAGLIALYCAEMTRRGVALNPEALATRYRLGALHGVATAVFSAAFVVRTPRGDANFLSMAVNACEQALDHDSIGALDALPEDGQC